MAKKKQKRSRKVPQKFSADIRRRQIQKQVRLVKIEQLLRKGITNQNALAARLGISQPTVSKYVAEIYDNWLHDNPRSARKARMLRVRQLEHVAVQAIDSYERSRKDQEEVTTVYQPVRCKGCKGTGWKDGKEETEKWCEYCDGSGTTLQEVVTRKIKGQAGDAAFLKTAKDAIAECAKIMGLYRKEKKEEKPLEGGNTFVMIDGRQADLSTVSSNLLLQAREALYRLTQVQEEEDEVIETTASEVEKPW